jgi:hypothetical protein
MLKRTASTALFSRVFPSVTESGKPDLFRSLTGPEDYTVFVVMPGADQALAHGLGAEAVEVSYAMPEDPEEDAKEAEEEPRSLTLHGENGGGNADRIRRRG